MCGEDLVSNLIIEATGNLASRLPKENGAPFYYLRIRIEKTGRRVGIRTSRKWRSRDKVLYQSQFIFIFDSKTHYGLALYIIGADRVRKEEGTGRRKRRLGTPYKAEPALKKFRFIILRKAKCK